MAGRADQPLPDAAPIYRLIRRARGRGSLNYGRHVIKGWARELEMDPVRVLDLGCGGGGDLAGVAEAVAPRTAELHGIETLERSAKTARERGIAVAGVDLERDRFPYDDATFDLVIANQVLEHTKEVFWIAAETARVLKSGGVFVVGVPNLASLHNRLLLAAGKQPSSIETLGPHVRGFTIPALRRLLTAGGYFTIRDVSGSNFYPFPAAIANPLARLWPGAAVSTFVAATRTAKVGSFVEVIDNRMDATPFRQAVG